MEVVDTPGLDSDQENILDIVIQIADIFNQCESINGILYAVSMAHNRDETISWFLNFLRLYFSKEQLSQAIIPILTHYDKIIFEDDGKVMEAKNSRKKAITRIWGEESEEIINFWENHIEWINDANQKAGLKQNEDFQKIYWTQLDRLVEKGRTINLPLAENAKNFENNLLTRLKEHIIAADGNYKQEKQEVPPFKFNVDLKKISFWKSLKEMKSVFSRILIGTVVVMGLKGFAHRKYKTFEKNAEKYEIGLMEGVEKGIDKIMNAHFLVELYEWISVSTSSKNTVEDLNRVFAKGGLCHIHITLPKESFFGIEKLELRRINPDSNDPIILLPK